MNFLSFAGNAAAKGALSSFLERGRTPHALLLEGPEGCGKKTLATLFSAALLCRGQGEVPCGVCPECHRVLTGIHPDVTLMENGGKAIGIEKIRQMRQEAYFKPTEADWRIFIIGDAHLLTPQSQNALLKILEEPPANVVILLTALSRSLLLSTVVSRTVCIPVEPLEISQCAAHVKKLHPAKSPDELSALCAAAGGCIGAANKLAQDGEYSQQRQITRRICQAVAAGDSAGLLLELGAFEKKREYLILFSKAFLSEVLCRARGEEDNPLAPLTDVQISRLSGVALELQGYLQRNCNTTLILTWMHRALLRAL